MFFVSGPFSAHQLPQRIFCSKTCSNHQFTSCGLSACSSPEALAPLFRLDCSHLSLYLVLSRPHCRSSAHQYLRCHDPPCHSLNSLFSVNKWRLQAFSVRHTARSAPRNRALPRGHGVTRRRLSCAQCNLQYQPTQTSMRRDVICDPYSLTNVLIF